MNVGNEPKPIVRQPIGGDVTGVQEVNAAVRPETTGQTLKQRALDVVRLCEKEGLWLAYATENGSELLRALKAAADAFDAEPKV